MLPHLKIRVCALMAPETCAPLNRENVQVHFSLKTLHNEKQKCTFLPNCYFRSIFLKKKQHICNNCPKSIKLFFMGTRTVLYMMCVLCYEEKVSTEHTKGYMCIFSTSLPLLKVVSFLVMRFLQVSEHPILTESRALPRQETLNAGKGTKAKFCELW